jgi:hypothetical protein
MTGYGGFIMNDFYDNKNLYLYYYDEDGESITLDGWVYESSEPGSNYWVWRIEGGEWHKFPDFEIDSLDDVITNQPEDWEVYIGHIKTTDLKKLENRPPTYYNFYDGAIVIFEVAAEYSLCD